MQDRRLAVGRGSLSGRPILADIVRITRDVAAWSEGALPIKAGGGALCGGDVLALLQAAQRPSRFTRRSSIAARSRPCSWSVS